MSTNSKEYSQKYREANRQKLIDRNTKWREENKDKVKEYFIKRRTTIEYKYQKYIYGAKSRKYLFNLTLEDFRKILSNPCHYCGTESKIGIDRKDNKVGYQLDNCLPCCKDCNYFKRSMDYEEFIKRCSMIATNHRLG
jgi:hypothetical protein